MRKVFHFFLFFFFSTFSQFQPLKILNLWFFEFLSPQIVGIISVFFICVSIVSFCLKTHPDMRVPVIKNITVKTANQGTAWVLDKTHTNAHEFFFYIECICNGWFTFEILVSWMRSLAWIEFKIVLCMQHKLSSWHGNYFKRSSHALDTCWLPSQLHLPFCVYGHAENETIKSIQMNFSQQIRFISSPSKCEFIMSFVNIIDYIATASFLWVWNSSFYLIFSTFCGIDEITEVISIKIIIW